MRTKASIDKVFPQEPELSSNDNLFIRRIKTIYFFIKKLSHDKIGVFAGQASFFMLLSFFPLVMLFLNIVGHTSLPESLIPTLIKNYTPSTIHSFLLQVVSELRLTSSGTAISLSAILSIWAASKGALAIISGMRDILDATSNLNYFVIRMLSIIYTILIIIGIALTLLLLVFGNRIFNSFALVYPILYTIEPLYTFLRYIVVMLILTIFFISMYKMGGNKRYKYMDLLPGAMFSALCWMIFSYLFSIYIDNYSNYSYMYGSITAIIIIMLWIYFCIYIMFIGAEIIEYLFDHK